MAKLRRLFAFILMFLSLLLLVVFALLIGVRTWSQECEVSQVFKLTRSTHLVGDNYMGVYDVAVTPLAPNMTAQTCALVAFTPIRYVNELDKKVWLLPLEEFQFAYDDSPLARGWTYWILGLSILFMTAGILAYKEKAG